MHKQLARSWRKLPFSVTVDADLSRLPLLRQWLKPDDYGTLEIEGESTGSYDPGYYRDANGDGCPPSGEDVRKITQATLRIERDSGDEMHVLTGIVLDVIEREYAKEIEGAELPEIERE